eukprot:TRINITY_DN180_c0_g1_i1.p1 TRINITY_DN180_c0_g1~~TRINITY_DN180_c0_g1_i1.p1  ORF type:complete len:161 (+),score=47.99 TRINITY_DN180_c0_g1_i1:78-560(+)
MGGSDTTQVISGDSLQDLLGPVFCNHDGTHSTWDETNISKADTIAIYFSASWCGPCKRFTPILAEAYEKAKAEGKNFEVIFASACSTEDDFLEYYHKMPWMAMRFQDKRIRALMEKFQVRGYPTVVILDREGKVKLQDAYDLMTDENSEKKGYDALVQHL